MTLAAAIVAVVLGAAPPAHAQTNTQLLYTCKQFVERRLDDPDSAKLDWTEGTVQKNKQGLYVVHFQGRAKNAYGAYRRGTFECVIQYKGNDQFTGRSIRVF